MSITVDSQQAAETAPDFGDWPQTASLPRDFTAGYGRGKDRAIVISGGGLAGLAFGGIYLLELAKAGVDFSNTELLVGTSAGSILGTEILSGNLRRFCLGMQFAAKSKIFEYIRKDAEPHPTAAHARALFDDAPDGSTETLIKIGHAAFAAKAPSQLSQMLQILAFTGQVTWPSAALRTTACDAYTGERLVYSNQSKVPLLTALAASTAVPGLTSTIKVGDRNCLDGGMGSGLNADVVAGAKKVFVLGLVADPYQTRWTNRAEQFDEELQGLRDAGSDVACRIPEEELGDPMDASTLPLGLRLGKEQAARDAKELKSFWS